ncbi:hypothetical protein LCGC14_1536600 [marine sediment metagenome]|uniref:HTH gntR-type domain-containing protein n=1 Tax=marine sediment metagenome TaxID=412755 RepID=A0A0F9IUC9_9ZZZZ
MEIPLVYQIIVDRLEGSAYKGEIELGHARRILRKHFRIPHTKVTSVFSELRDMELIIIENHNLIKINVEVITWEREILNGKV